MFRVWMERTHVTFQGQLDWRAGFLIVLLIAYVFHLIRGASESGVLPLPDHTYIISSNGKVLTAYNGHVVLVSPGSGESVRWNCVQTNNWLGFRDIQSPYAYLGHDTSLNLQAVAASQRAWENFIVKPAPSGGHMMLMVHSEPFQPDILWYVGMQGANLAKLSDWAEGGIIFKFTEVK